MSDYEFINLKEAISELRYFTQTILEMIYRADGSPAFIPYEVSQYWPEVQYKIREFCEDLNHVCNFITENTARSLIQKIKNALILRDEFEVLLKKADNPQDEKVINKFHQLHLSINELSAWKINFKEQISSFSERDIQEIIKFILKKTTILDESGSYLKQLSKISEEDKNEFINRTIILYNMYINGDFSIELKANLNNFLLECLYNSINKEEIKLKEKEKEALIRIESARNQSTIIEFKNKADSLKVYIYILNFWIVSLFIFIILLFLQKYYSPPEVDIKLIYSIGLIIAISSLMAFLIKEKNILSSQYYNYIKCHTEMVALSTYIVDIDKIKSEDLKIRLAEKYFTGYLQADKEANSNAISNESINQLISLIKETQKK
ncbi:hypothetical protein OHV72_04345 [Acinetobacter baumannii]|nr:hypothetical protein [Acinetobacter baumannii]MDV7600341.1 hypothetical protein [Acinetobacter baumannii]